MVIPRLAFRVTAQLTSCRTFPSLINLFKASKQSVHHHHCHHYLCPSSLFQVERLRVDGGSVRFKSDFPTDRGRDDGSSSDSSDSSDSDESDSKKSTDQSINDTESDELPPSMTRKYKLFEKSEEELILDYREELLVGDDLNHTDWPSEGINFPFSKRQSKFDDVNLERGQNEVIDIEELVTILRQENVQDIFVLSLPIELNYTDYMLIASAKSVKHLEAVVAYLTKVWKLKRHSDDPFISLEGDDSPDWKTLDMGSIMVHLFLPETRQKYDLETLWSVGVKYDDLTQKPVIDPSVDLLEKHLQYLKNVEPATPPIRRAEMIPIPIKPRSMTKAQIKELQREMIQGKSNEQNETR